MKAKEYKLPEFLLAEFPIKNGDYFNDNRHFVVHRGITLIEIIALDDVVELIGPGKVQKKYTYGLETFLFVYHTNNAHYHNINEIDLLDRAFEWYKEYLEWEDNNIDTINKSHSN